MKSLPSINLSAMLVSQFSKTLHSKSRYFPAPDTDNSHDSFLLQCSWGLFYSNIQPEQVPDNQFFSQNCTQGAFPIANLFQAKRVESRLGIDWSDFGSLRTQLLYSHIRIVWLDKTDNLTQERITSIAFKNNKHRRCNQSNCIFINFGAHLSRITNIEHVANQISSSQILAPL